jgi:hypothetical protein
MSKFSLDRDFNRIAWGRTLWLNLLRAFCAGIVWAIIVLVFGIQLGSGMSSVMLPLIAPIAYIFFLIAYLAIAKIPFIIPVGLLRELTILAYGLILGLAIAVGDPLVFIIHSIKPNLIPVEKFDFINFKMCIFVLN